MLYNSKSNLILIKIRLLNAIEKGFNYRYLKEFLWHTNPVCPVMTQAAFESLGLSEVCSAFFGLAFMYLATLFILIAEKWLSKFRNERISNTEESRGNHFPTNLKKIKNVSNNAAALYKKDNHIVWVIRRSNKY